MNNFERELCITARDGNKLIFEKVPMIVDGSALNKYTPIRAIQDKNNHFYIGLCPDTIEQYIFPTPLYDIALYRFTDVHMDTLFSGLCFRIDCLVNPDLITNIIISFMVSTIAPSDNELKHLYFSDCITTKTIPIYETNISLSQRYGYDYGNLDYGEKISIKKPIIGIGMDCVSHPEILNSIIPAVCECMTEAYSITKSLGIPPLRNADGSELVSGLEELMARCYDIKIRPFY